MKPSRLLAILVLSTLALSANAQPKQPPPPPVSVFPLGGLTASGPNGDYKDEFPLFGFNMWYNGSPAQLNPGQGAIGDIGGTDATTGGLSLDGAFFPQNVYNPYFFEANIDLASNESGLSAWDLNNAWNTPVWDPAVTYQTGQLALYPRSAPYPAMSNLWVCTGTNVTGAAEEPASGSSNWKQVQTPLPWNSTLQYSPLDPNNPNPGGAGLDDYVTFGGVLWRCTATTTAQPENANWSVWMNPTVWDNDSKTSTHTDFHYSTNEYVWDNENNTLWQCLLEIDNTNGTGIPEPSTNDGTHWKQVPGSFPVWTTTGAFNQRDYAIVNITDIDGNPRPWIFYSLAGGNTGNQPVGIGWIPAIWQPNPSSPFGGFDNVCYNPGDLVCYYHPSGSDNPNPFYQSPDANSTWPIRNTIWVASTPYGQNCGGGNWVQLAPKTGQPAGSNNMEWQIPASTVALNSTTYLDYTFNANGPWTWTGDFLGGNRTLYVDFVYTLDRADDYPSLQSTDPTPLYKFVATAEYYDPINGASANVSHDTVVSFYDYTHYAQGGTYSTNSSDSHWGNDVKTENPRILNFPDSKDPGNPIPDKNQYAVRRLGFDLQKDLQNNQSFPEADWPKVQITSVHFTLEQTTGSHGIYVRGVRLRTEDMDMLLRGKLNAPNSNFYWPPTQTTTTWAGLTSGANGLFQTIKNNFDTKYASFGAAAAWNNWLGIQVGNEMNWNAFRVYAYIDSLWRQWTRVHTGQQKELYQILTNGNQPYYRAIFEDETGSVPPALQNEGIGLWAGGPNRSDHDFTSGSLIFPGDAIPAEVKNHSSFLEFALGITGWNGVTGTGSAYGSTSTTPITTGVNKFDDYQHYTTYYQNSADGISSINKSCAETCYPQVQFGNPSVWTTYWSYPSTFALQNVDNEGNDHSLSIVNTSQLNSDIQSGALQLPVTYSDLQQNKYLVSGKTVDDLKKAFSFESLYPPTREEIREETWDGIAWGAKGILYNPIGDDQSDNIGICGPFWETSPNSGFGPENPPDVANDDHITGPDPAIIVPTWEPNPANGPYPYATWVMDANTNTNYLCKKSPATYPRIDPATDPTDWLPPYSFSETSILSDPRLYITGIPGYYGMKDRSDGVKRAMADIAPIAQELKNLQWVTAYDYADMSSSDAATKAWAKGFESDGVTPNLDGLHPTGDAEFPLTIAASNQVAQSYDANTNSLATLPFTTSGVTDESVSLPLYYNIGVFHDPNDAGVPPDLDAVYVTVANRRTWPIIYNSDQTQVVAQDRTTSTAYDYLGAIDARIVDFKLKTTGWTDYQGNPVNWGSNYSYYTITDIRGKNLQRSTDNGATWSDAGTELVNPISSSALFRIELDPGEGTLLRIAPATSVELGRTPYAGMAYNNGHRMCDISDPCNPHEHGVVWEDNGKIMFCRVANEANALPDDPISLFLAKNGIDTSIYQVKTVYDPAVAHPNTGHEFDGHNPSIACQGSQVAVVYSIDDFADQANASRSVVFATSAASSDYNTWTTMPIAVNLQYVTPIVKDLTGNVPASTASYNLLTPVITPSQDGYFIAYTDNAAIRTYLIRTSDMSINFFGAVSGKLGDQCRMVSLASRPDIRTDPEGLNAEIIDMAWEEDHGDGTSDIWFKPFYHVPGNLIWTYGTQKIVSKACYNYHPMVAEKPPTGGTFGMPIITWESGGRSILREMTNWNAPPSQPTWSPFKSFSPKPYGAWVNSNLPLPQIRVENALCGGSANGYVEPLMTELIYQDTFNHFERIERYKQNSSLKYDWTAETKLKEYAQQGSVSMPYGSATDPTKPDLDGALYPDQGVMSFRGIWADENNEYAAKIVTSPPAEMSVPVTLVQGFTITPNSYQVVCLGSAMSLALGTNIITTSPPPPPPPPPPVQWTDNPIGSYTETPINDTESMLTESGWPITEDSIRTNYFPATTPFSLNMNRLLTVDTTQLDSVLPNASHWISYKLVVKDSATREITQVLDSAIVTGPTQQGLLNEPGINPNDTTIMGQGYHVWGPIQPTPSGSAYITVLITKDSLTQASLNQEQVYCDSLALPVPSADTASSDSGAYKRLQPQAIATPQQELDVTVHPNPVHGTVKICVADLPGGIAATVDVVNEMGVAVATLYNATPDAELGLCLQLDCSNLPSGTYYADLQTQGMHKAVQFSVQH